LGGPNGQPKTKAGPREPQTNQKVRLTKDTLTTTGFRFQFFSIFLKNIAPAGGLIKATLPKLTIASKKATAQKPPWAIKRSPNNKAREKTDVRSFTSHFCAR